ncbi:MAG: N-acetylglucosamine-6-phosphate deacetylase [Candidatus Atribacteria bacterium]|nr:N-acetylglucosamine-6-phosphate deacetylase [Candidatus Atribacteria bacterium]
MSRIGIVGNIVTPHRLIENATLLVEGKKIVGINESKESELKVDKKCDFTGKFIYPGLIDLHLHGALGHDTTDGDLNGLKEMTKYFATCGVTGFLATTVSESYSRLKKAIEIVSQFRNEHHISYAQILGIHLEGPYLSEGRRGAHNVKNLRAPNLSEMEEFLSIDPGLIKRVTLAPELPGSLELIEFLSKQDVCVSLGHSQADQETCYLAYCKGAHLITHLFNGMDPLNHRKPNLLSFALGFDDITVELIADMIHVHPDIMKIALKCKDEDHFIAVSDAVRPTGFRDGEYEFGGELMIVENGIARMKSTMSLAGSTTPLNRCLANLRSHFQISHSRLAQIGSLIPAQLIGMEHQIGSLEINKNADIVIFDDELNCHATFIHGEKI